VDRGEGERERERRGRRTYGHGMFVLLELEVDMCIIEKSVGTWQLMVITADVGTED
jgi:hypothetical protein